MGGESEEGRFKRKEQRGAIRAVGFEIDAWEEIAFDLTGKKDRPT
jgi:hypothetical protein